MKKMIVLTLLGLVAFIGFLIAGLPASAVWRLAEQRNLVPQNIEISGVEGTLWEGTARQVVINDVKLPKTSWALSSNSLPEQALQVNVEIGHVRSELFGKGLLSWDGEQLKVSGVKARASEKKIQEWIKLPAPVVIDGRLSVSIPSMTIKQGRCVTLNGEGLLRQAGVNTPFGEVNLGQVSFDLSCQSNQVHVVAQQNSPELKVTAKLIVDMDGRYTVSGHLFPKDELTESFRKNLSFLGRANSKGEYPLNTRGVL
ncbi:hypothetical protein ACH42_15135 [Endozoicomonas sp. (ex Bugula neritina AB1)]|nr:hypothetical protein ACH42_15135 [Endozoicomonas sp. (ex Bugula neritina AB1)]